MRNFFARLFGKKRNDNETISSISDAVFREAYKQSLKEIKSLEQYDRGEKIITPPDFKSLVERIQNSR